MRTEIGMKRVGGKVDWGVSAMISEGKWSLGLCWGVDNLPHEAVMLRYNVGVK